MKVYFTTLAIFLMSIKPFAQFVDDFSDGDFTNNPAWFGTEGKFVIDSGQLRLDAPAENSSAYLATKSQSIEDAIWEFTVKMDFNPSSVNYVKIHLVSDTSDLTLPQQGYFIKAGGRDDEVSLYRQNGTTEVEIIDGLDNLLDTTQVNIRVKVTRSVKGDWEILVANPVEEPLESQGTVFDNTYKISSYFGVFCEYTSTRSSKFFFDDFNVSGFPFRDKAPPEIINLSPVNATLLKLKFNEILSMESAANESHYLINDSEVQSVNYENDTVAILLAEPMANGSWNDLLISSVSDTSGNVMNDTTIRFFYYEEVMASFRDIVINEIFADPYPVVELPESEYVELYNRSTKPFIITDWIWSDSRNEVSLDSAFIGPGDYLILCPSGSISDFEPYGKTLGVSSWPALNNAGDDLKLYTKNGFLIDRVIYTLNWYNNFEKQEGGWSLELIDPENPCGEENNWRASKDNNGGTPGKENSLFASKPDLTGPDLEEVIVLSPTNLELRFNERLDSITLSKANYTLKQPVEVVGIDFSRPDVRKIFLNLNPALNLSEIYQIKVDNLRDCNGNTIRKNVATFSIPESADSMDIVINEILFNPYPRGVDFVELYNRSDKHIDLKDWLIANGDPDGLVKTSKPITGSNKIIKPGEFIVLTDNAAILKSHYPLSADTTFLIMSNLPSYPNDEGHVILINSTDQIIDSFIYSEDLHSEALDNYEGVSLERLSYEKPTHDDDNWYSAASTAGFATPGYQNSHFVTQEMSVGEVFLDPQIFSPDNDGRDDFTRIHYIFNDPGLTATVRVFDISGRQIRKLAENALLQHEGFFIWDGTNDDRKIMNEGYYIIYFEAFNLKGYKKQYKKKVVLSGG